MFVAMVHSTNFIIVVFLGHKIQFCASSPAAPGPVVKYKHIKIKPRINLCTIYFVFELDGEANSLKQNI